MPDYPVQAVDNRSPAQPSQSLITLTLVIYGLFAIGVVLAIVSHGIVVVAPLFAVAGIIGVVLLYLKRGDARGTWLESHYRWLLRTFWYSLLWGLVGWVVLVLLALVLIGLALGPLIWLATALWVIYRVIRGFLLFQDSRPIPGM